MNGMGRKGEEDQTSMAGQFPRQYHSTKRKFYNQSFELSEASAVSPGVVKHLRVWKF